MGHCTLHTLGARGSRPASGAVYSEFGSETSCYLLKKGTHALVIDCGTGLYSAHALLQDCTQIDVVFTHLHYDHLLGLLDFAAFPASANVTFYGAFTRWLGTSKLSSFFQPPFWPVAPNHTYVNVAVEQEIQLEGGISFTIYPSSHPDEGCFIGASVLGRNICFCFDFEYTGSACDPLLDAALSKGCDLLLFDGMYDAEEYSTRKGWGHSTWMDGIEIAKRYQAEFLYYTHHDPSHTDSILRKREQEAQKHLLAVAYARAGDSIMLTADNIFYAKKNAKDSLNISRQFIPDLQPKEDRYEQALDQLKAEMDGAKTFKDGVTIAVNRMVDLANSEAGTLWLWDSQSGYIRPSKTYGGADLSRICLDLDEGIAGHVIRTGQSLFIGDCTQDKRWASWVDHTTGFHTNSLICVPLSAWGTTFGCIQLINRHDNTLFDRADADLCTKLANAIVQLFQEYGFLEAYRSILNSKSSGMMVGRALDCATAAEMQQVLIATNHFELLTPEEREDMLALSKKMYPYIQKMEHGNHFATLFLDSAQPETV